MIGDKLWRHLETRFFVGSSFSSCNRIFDRNGKVRNTQSRALRYAFILLVIKYTLFGGSVWRFCERKKERNRPINVKLIDRMDTGIS